jgi:Holliday junction resolvasome RuvABC ATP-dependent DNA helicase subunit
MIENQIDPEVWSRKLLKAAQSQPYNGKPIVWFGQQTILDQIEPFLYSDDPFPHTLLLGEPGLGKSHLAKYIAYTRNEAITEVLAPASPLSMPIKGIILLDEVHRQRTPEPLFEMMVNEIPTVIAATARPELVDRAFRTRFFLNLHLKPYSETAMSELIGSLLDASDATLSLLGTAAAGNPRQAEKIATVAIKMGTDDPELILSTCRITADGLTLDHLEYLRLLKQINRPMGASQIATLMYTDETSVKYTERLLLDYELIQLLPNGRRITRKGNDYIMEFDG